MNQKEKIQELLEMCYYGHIDQVRELIDEGVDVNTINQDGITPLMAAKDSSNSGIINYLISVGAKE